MPLPGSTGYSTPEWTAKMIIYCLVIMILAPVLFMLFVPAVTDGDTYREEIADLEEEYYNQTGNKVTATTEVWALTGIYTPYVGSTYGYTDDGWVYGERVVNNSPSQYVGSNGYSVRLMDNGLYYYTAVPANDLTHTAATYANGTWDYSDASLYTAVTMDNSYKSTIFFTETGKSETADGHYYYQYNGYRYAFQPLRSYQTESGDEIITVQANSSSLSLLWYQYSSYSGIAGQLSISGSDQGLSYITAADITKAFNSATYTSTFDMTFNNIKMHLSIHMDIERINSGLSAAECYNAGFWSVVVSSDAVASSQINDSSYDFSIDNIFQTLIDMFSFRLTDDYDISGWEATIVSVLFALPFYAILIALALQNYYLLIGVALIGLIQSLSSFSLF